MADRSVTLTWQEPLTSIREYQPKDTWIFDLVWEEMTEDAGLYVIEDSAGDCLYAGQADNTLSRFRCRNEPLREFRLLSTTNPVESYKVRCATLNPFMDTDSNPKLIDLVERWLIRFIYKFQEDGGNLRLQNVSKTDEYVFATNFKVAQANNKLMPDYIPELVYDYAQGDDL
jgi:hypothetical protein